MTDFRHKRNGIVIDEPRNWSDLKITKDFMGLKDDTRINISELVFAGEEAIRIRQRIMNGKNGGIGVFEGDPYQVEVGEQGNPAFIFDGYLDYASGVEFKGCNEVVVALKKRKGADWLNDKADSFSFRYLHSIGHITSSDFVKVPYVINYVPDNMQVIMLSISIFIISKELYLTIKNLAEAIADTIDAATPVIGASVGVGAGVVTAWDLGNFIMVAIKAIAYIAYTIAMVVAIKKLIEELIEQLLPKKREHLGMTLYSLFDKACSHLGLGFKSSLLSSRKNWVMIPSKDHKGGEKPTDYDGTWVETGVPSANDSWDTFGDLIRFWKEYFNADYKIVNGVFEFEREDYWNTAGNFVIEDYYIDQDELVDSFKLNVEEVSSNYNINWAYDTQDQNTLDNQNGRVFQAILEPNVFVNKDLINLKNLQLVGLNCSLGLRKDSLTAVEKIFKTLGTLVDALTSVLGGGTNFASNIDARKGSLLLSSHFLTVPKMVVMSGDKLATNQRALLSAKKLWDELHYINSFVEINGTHNQWIRYAKRKVPFCMENFLSLLDSHFCKTKDGRDAMIERLEWNVWQDFALIDYRIKDKYTDNLKLKYIT